MNRLFLAVVVIFATSVTLFGETSSALDLALEAEPVQAAYLARHPEILRWIGKHPQLNEKAKNNAINEWVTAWPKLSELLAKNPEQALAWADDPRPLAEFAKKPRK